MTINRFEAPYGYVAINMDYTCDNCFFYELTNVNFCCSKYHCLKGERQDKKNVVFKPIDNHYFFHTGSDTQPRIVKEFFDVYPFGKIIAYYKDYMNSVQCHKRNLYIVEWDKVKYFIICSLDLFIWHSLRCCFS